MNKNIFLKINVIEDKINELNLGKFINVMNDLEMKLRFILSFFSVNFILMSITFENVLIFFKH